MTERKLIVSFGHASPAAITDVKQMDWPAFAKWLTTRPPESPDKAARGWYCPVEFSPAYRDSENFVARHALTFDFDHVGTGTWAEVLAAWENVAFAMYTTWSHVPGKPRFRVVMPLSRPASYDEFQAVARMVAADLDIELFARESFTPSQMMFAPTRRPNGEFKSHVNDAAWLDVDEVLAEYKDWTDHTTWPHRKDGDGVHKAEQQTRPDEKPGAVGEFCRAFRVADAIKRFGLPYTPTATEGRWTYTAGSRPEGAIEYDDGLKFHSHHDTDPARGQNNAFDLVRLHKFGDLDTETDRARPVSERPSYRAMVELAYAQPELRAVTAKSDFEILGPLVEQEVVVSAAPDVADTVRFLVQEAVEFSSGPPMRWIIKNVLPRAELVVIAGQPSVGKSFLALDLSSAITRGVKWRDRKTEKGRVVYIAAEGAGGFRQRLRAYAKSNGVQLTELPAVIADAPNLLDPKDAAAVTAALVKWGKPAVVVVDTLSAVAPGGNENSGEDMGLLLSHCKFIHKETGALVVLIHHVGKDESRGTRGWSGIRGAVDAEIIVARNGDYHVARVTKMKDGADNAQYPFKLRTVPVGVDADGEDVTSCIVEHTEELPPEAGKIRARPGGKYEPVVLDVLKRTACGTSVDLDDLLEGCKKHLAKEGDGKDQRKKNAKRGLDGLIAKKLAFMTDGRVSLQSVHATDESAFEIQQ
jgi:hypothetical protein